MSLIPSESYSFPDLSEGAIPKKRKGEDLEPEPNVQPEPGIMLPAVGPSENAINNSVPIEEPMPEMEPFDVSGFPPPLNPLVPLTPVARSAPVIPEVPSAPVAPVAPAAMPRPAKPNRPVRPGQTPGPVGSAPIQPPKRVSPVVPLMPTVPDELAQPGVRYDEPEPEIIEALEEDIPDFQFPGWGEEPRFARKRRRNKVIRFIFLEALAFALLIVSTKLEVADQFSENSLTIVYKALMVVAVIAMAGIPVIFFALPPTLPPSRR